MPAHKRRKKGKAPSLLHPTQPNPNGKVEKTHRNIPGNGQNIFGTLY